MSTSNKLSRFNLPIQYASRTSSIMNRTNREAAVLLIGVCVFVLGGCSKGPSRYDVSGIATYNGKPIPRGAIVLNADHQSGNTGPQGRAEIHNGEISIKDGMGTSGGSQWIQIMGSDGNNYRDHEGTLHQGKSLFDMVQTKIELPKQDVTLDVRITSTKNPKEKSSVEIKVVE